MKKTPFVVTVVAAIFLVAVSIPTIAASPKLILSHRNPMKFDETKFFVEPESLLAKPLAAKKWAVIIGIADYQGTGSDLWHPDEDAKEMYSELTRQQGYPKANVKLITNRGATAQAIVNAISWLVTNEKAGDEVVFFYSGHGYRAPDSDGWDSDV